MITDEQASAWRKVLGAADLDPKVVVEHPEKEAQGLVEEDRVVEGWIWLRSGLGVPDTRYYESVGLVDASALGRGAWQS